MDLSERCRERPDIFDTNAVDNERCCIFQVLFEDRTDRDPRFVLFSISLAILCAPAARARPTLTHLSSLCQNSTYASFQVLWVEKVCTYTRAFVPATLANRLVRTFDRDGLVHRITALRAARAGALSRGTTAHRICTATFADGFGGVNLELMGLESLRAHG